METETHGLEPEFVTFVFTNTVSIEDFSIQEEIVNFNEERQTDVPALSRSAPGDVLQRLAEERRVESMDLGEESDTQCPICIDNLSKSHEKIIKMPQCEHIFHQACLFEWLGRRNSCPLCRRVPYEKDQENRDSNIGLGS